MSPLLGRSQLDSLVSIRTSFKSPEHINDGQDTAPSKRLLGLYPVYDNVAFGPRIVQAIGIKKLRQECIHFDDWLMKLEALSPYN